VRIPGFTADAALSDSGQRYRSAATSTYTAAASGIIPAQSCTGPVFCGPANSCITMLVATTPDGPAVPIRQCCGWGFYPWIQPVVNSSRGKVAAGYGTHLLIAIAPCSRIRLLRLHHLLLLDAARRAGDVAAVARAEDAMTRALVRAKAAHDIYFYRHMEDLLRGEPEPAENNST
jgi:hypothetical protein